MGESEVTEQITPEMERVVARWDLDVVIFLFALLTIVIILSFQEIGVEINAPVAVFELATV